MDGSAFITWEQLKTFPGQVFAITALTGILYRMLRARWPDTPEAVVQAIALIIAIATNLMTTYQASGAPEGSVVHQWVLLGVFNGVVVGTVVIKSIDWITTAKTNTGAPQVGMPEKPPAWFVAELAKGTTVVSAGPVEVQKVENVAAQQKVNDAAVAKAVKEDTP